MTWQVPQQCPNCDNAWMREIESTPENEELLEQLLDDPVAMCPECERAMDRAEAEQEFIAEYERWIEEVAGADHL